MSEAINYSYAYTDAQMSVGHSLSPIKSIQGFTDNRPIKQDLTLRKTICDLEKSVLGLENSYDDTDTEALPLTHHFAPDVYGREMLLPVGNVVVGKLHRHAHLNVILKGKVRVTTEEGTTDYTAPHIFTSFSGTKRAVYVLEETIWLTIHPTDKETLEEIEDYVIAKTYDDLNRIESK